jgi:hypothetical protein
MFLHILSVKMIWEVWGWKNHFYQYKILITKSLKLLSFSINFVINFFIDYIYNIASFFKNANYFLEKNQPILKGD